MMEGYVCLKNFEDLYIISEFGIVRKKKTLKILSSRSVDARECVSLTKNGVSKSYPLHKLIAQTFIPNPDELPLVLHINRDRFDNRIENLKWVSRKDYYPPNACSSYFW
jgi:hypothetical protein